MAIIGSFVNVIAGVSVLLGSKSFMDDRVGGADGPKIRDVIGVPLLGVGVLGILVSYVRNKSVRGEKKAENDDDDDDLSDCQVCGEMFVSGALNQHPTTLYTVCYECFENELEEDDEGWVDVEDFNWDAETFNADEDRRLKAFARQIENEKKKLIKKAKGSGFYENFGEKEVRKLEDSITDLDYYERQKYKEMIREFENWAYSIDLRDLEHYAETESNCPVCKGEVHADMSMIGEEIDYDICGDCDIYIMPQGISCVECGFGDPYGSATPCESCEPIAEKMEKINKNAENFGAETFEATDVGKRMKCRGCNQWEYIRGFAMNNFLQDDKGKWRCYNCLYDKPKHKVVVIGRGKHKPFARAETFDAQECPNCSSEIGRGGCYSCGYGMPANTWLQLFGAENDDDDLSDCQVCGEMFVSGALNQHPTTLYTVCYECFENELEEDDEGWVDVEDFNWDAENFGAEQGLSYADIPDTTLAGTNNNPVRIIVGGPPHSGKSTLMNLIEDKMNQYGVAVELRDLDFSAPTDLKGGFDEEREKKDWTPELAEEAANYFNEDSENRVILGDSIGLISRINEIVSKPADVAILLVSGSQGDDEKTYRDAMRKWFTYYDDIDMPVLMVIRSSMNPNDKNYFDPHDNYGVIVGLDRNAYNQGGDSNEISLENACLEGIVFEIAQEFDLGLANRSARKHIDIVKQSWPKLKGKGTWNPIDAGKPHLAKVEDEYFEELKRRKSFGM